MNSFISWIGGKRLLRKEIVSQFPNSFSRYIEVFGGAAWVLFFNNKHADLEVYNDVNGELVNLFKCVKFHAEELQRQILCINSRELYEDYKAARNLRGLTDIQRAANYFLLIRLSFGSDIRTFGCNKKNVSNAVKGLSDIQERLKDVVIENRDFSYLIKTYDRSEALFYADPPYHTTEKYYDAPFSEDDHHRLKNNLTAIKGHFILSYNDDSFIRDLYRGYNIIEVIRHNSLAGNGNRFKELIIKNY